jgi:hypothetical protein
LGFCPASETDVDLRTEKCITDNKDEAQAGLTVRTNTSPSLPLTDFPPT